MKLLMTTLLIQELGCDKKDIANNCVEIKLKMLLDKENDKLYTT